MKCSVKQVTMAALFMGLSSLGAARAAPGTCILLTAPQSVVGTFSFSGTGYAAGPNTFATPVGHVTQMGTISITYSGPIGKDSAVRVIPSGIKGWTTNSELTMSRQNSVWDIYGSITYTEMNITKSFTATTVPITIFVDVTTCEGGAVFYVNNTPVYFSVLVTNSGNSMSFVSNVPNFFMTYPAANKL